MDYQTALQTALYDHKFVKKILRHAGILPSHPEFEDYYHDALILYAECKIQITDYPPQTAAPKTFLYQQILWRLTDMIRHDLVQNDHFPRLKDPQQYDDKLCDDDYNFELTCLVQELYQRLRPLEFEYLHLHYLSGHSREDTCLIMGISKRTAFRLQAIIHAEARQLRWCS